MDNFDFLSIPLEIQEIIVKEIVHNSVPDDRINFALSSKYSNWLVKRSKSKKIVYNGILYLENGYLCLKYEPYFSKRIKTNNYDRILNMFQSFQFKELFVQHSFFTEENQFLTPEFEQALKKASKFVTTFKTSLYGPIDQKFMEFYQNMNHLQLLRIFHCSPYVMQLPRLPPNLRFSYSGFNVPLDNFFRDLAGKTVENPLSTLRVEFGVDLDVIKMFLQTATFNDGANVIFNVAYYGQNIETTIKSIGKHEIVKIPSAEIQGFPYYNNAILLKENVKLVSSKKTMLTGVYVSIFIHNKSVF